MFSISPIMFLFVFMMIIIIFIVISVKGLGRSNNSRQPVLAVPAKIISKRTHVLSCANKDFGTFKHKHTSALYYLTFEVETGSRIEFDVSGNEYDLLTEGATGKLKFQGTRYLSFEQNI
jgi:hypothetical protein